MKPLFVAIYYYFTYPSSSETVYTVDFFDWVPDDVDVVEEAI
jgi:hypothetical protein